MVSLDDFAKIELRVGEIFDAVDVSGSNKLLQLTVDFGELGKKTVFSGIKKWYTADSLPGRKFMFVVNLEPKEFPFGTSEGMILAASPPDGEAGEEAVLYTFDKDVRNGTKIN